MKRALRFLPVLLLLLLAGCLDLEQNLELNADGSGRLKVACTYSAEAVTVLTGQERPLPPPLQGFRPQDFPLTEASIQALAQRLGAEAGDIAVTPAEAGGKTVRFSLAFRDVRQFSRRARGFFTIDMHAGAKENRPGYRFRLLGVGMQTLVNRFERAEKDGRTAGELALARLLGQDARYRLTVRMPVAVPQSNAHKKDGATVSWGWDELDIVNPKTAKRQTRVVIPELAVPAAAFNFPDPAPAAAVKVPTAGEIQCRFNRIELDYRTYTWRNEVRQSRSVAISGEVLLPPGTLPIGMRPPTVSVATTAAGDDLRPSRRRRQGNTVPPGGSPTRLPLQLPPMTATADVAGLNTLKGSVVLRFATGAASVRLANPAQGEDSWLDPKQLGQVRIRLETEDDSFSLLVDRNSRDLVRSLAIETADGKVIPAPRPDQDRGRWRRYRYRQPFPAGAAVHVEFYRGVQEVDVPFLVETLDFPPAG